MNSILNIKNLSVQFESFDKSFLALRDLSLVLNEGEMLGIVGGAGSGKSILLKSIMNLVPNPGKIIQGEIFYRETDLLRLNDESMQKIRGREISLILSNPRMSLNPLQTIGDQISSAILNHKEISKKLALDMALDMLTKVGIPDPKRRLKTYPHELSGGMCQRVLIGIALINSPKVLLADEISSGLDVTVQRQVLDLLANLINDFRSSTMIVTRDFGVVANYCKRIIVMYEGEIVEIDNVSSFFDRAQHPISLKLLKSTFAAKGKREDDNDLNYSEPKNKDKYLIGSNSLIEIEPGHYVRESTGNKQVV